MNAVDIAVVVVLLASGIFALMRGFVYEVLAMAGWIAAGFAALWGLPIVRPFLHNYISSPTIADIVGGFALFLVTLLVTSLVTHAISRSVQRSAVSSVDRSLGFAFGLLRGLFLCSLLFLLVTKIMAPDEPQVLQAAKTRPLMAAGSRIVLSLAPASMSGVDAHAREVKDLADQAKQVNDVYERLAAPKPKAAEQTATDKQPAYDSHSLERLIETTGNGK